MKFLLLLLSCLLALTWWPAKKPAAKLHSGAEWNADQLEARAVLAEVNALRTAGCKCPGGKFFQPASPLRWNDRLERAAQNHADDMRQRRYFNHESPEGATFSRRIEQAGYQWRVVGENIAMGYATAQAVVDAWRKSKDHCPNLMHPDFKDMGVGKAGKYWVQDLGAE